MAKLVILAVDIRRNPLQYGTDIAVREIIAECEEKKLPFVFAGTRKELGTLFLTNV